MRGKREEILENQIMDGAGAKVRLVRVDHVRNTYLVFGEISDIPAIMRLLGKKYHEWLPGKGENQRLIGTIIDGNQGITEEVDDERTDT